MVGIIVCVCSLFIIYADTCMSILAPSTSARPAYAALMRNADVQKGDARDKDDDDMYNIQVTDCPYLKRFVLHFMLSSHSDF
jgi:hypothetical protein